jgi:hypothetical protein
MSRYLAIDVEASGQNVSEHRMLAIGACVVSSHSVAVCEPRAEHIFRAVLCFQRPPPPPYEGDGAHELPVDWDLATAKEFWFNAAKGADGDLPIDHLCALATTWGVESPDAAMDRFVAWCAKMGQWYGKDIVIITDTASFDAGWIQYYLSRHGTHDKYPRSMDYLLNGRHQQVRDMASFYNGMARHLPEDGKRSAGAAALAALATLGVVGGFPTSVTSVPRDHDPAHDAERMALEAAYVTKVVRDMRPLRALGAATMP